MVVGGKSMYCLTPSLETKPELSLCRSTRQSKDDYAGEMQASGLCHA